MTRHQGSTGRIAVAGVAALAALGSLVAPSAAASDDAMWVHVNACDRVERSAGHVDIDGHCVADAIAVFDDVTLCARHFCPAEPFERGAIMLHPEDFPI
jgi:hypothetical protein